MALDAVGHQRPKTNFSVTRCKFNQAPILNLSLSRKLTRNFNPDIRSLRLNTADFVGHIAFVKMLKQTTIVEEQIKFIIDLLVRLEPSHGIKPSFAIGEVELFCKQ